MPTDKNQIQTWMGRLPQSAYGTASGSGADYRNVICNEQNTFEGIGAPSMDDNSSSDKGTDLADDMWAISNSTGVNIPFDFNFQDIGYHLYDCLGGYSVSGSGPYTHVFTPQDANTSRQLPARTILKKYGGIETLLMRDAVCTELNIIGAKTNRLKCTSQRTGSGYFEKDPASYTRPSTESDRVYAFAQQARFWLDEAAAGTAQVETATIAVTTVTAGTLLVTVTSNLLYGSPIVVPVTVAGGETANQVAALVRTALASNFEINKHYIVGGSSATYTLTARVKAANDTTLNMGHAVGTAGGITTAATSTNTTAGVAGDTAQYYCNLQGWTLSLKNPEQHDGYTTCSRFLTDGDERTGAIKSEYPFGTRDYMFTFDTWKASSDKLRGWVQSQKTLKLVIPIVSTRPMASYTSSFYSLTIEHTHCRVMSAPDSINDPNIAVSGSVKMLSNNGSIPLTITLVNDVASYAS